METIKNFILEMFGYSRTEWSIGGIIGFVGGVFGAMVGGYDLFIKLLLFTMAFDIVTGLMNSKKHKSTSSETGIRGLNKKVGILIMIAFANIVDQALGQTGSIRTGAILFYFSMEGLSLLENLTAMGVPQFQPLAEYLIQIKEGNKKGPSKLIKEEEEN
ncbi:phage holin family protein [Irregularibacter muris]|uniref:Phage holin family protein n=1 Tax=Irregularibacter muris TaxID=1796619 RepID=A0AAE3HE67_9FIRM|nr:phage holin family protein [Irregularibacter muris]MCR1897830.1 phage holin family protein [Irregularibacter muris]